MGNLINDDEKNNVEVLFYLNMAMILTLSRGIMISQRKTSVPQLTDFDTFFFMFEFFFTFTSHICVIDNYNLTKPMFISKATRCHIKVA